MLHFTPSRNFCRPSEYTQGRGYVLSIEDMSRPVSELLDYLQRTNFGMGVTVVRLRTPEGLPKARRAPWLERVHAHLEASEDAMNREASSVSLCRSDTLTDGRYVREWWLAIIDNARDGDAAFNDFCATNQESPLRAFAMDRNSPIFEINRRAEACRLATADALLALCEPPLERDSVDHTPFFQMRVLDDGETMQGKFLSHVCGDQTRAVVALSPAQGFWFVEFPHRGVGLGFPVTLPRVGQFVSAEPGEPLVPAVWLCEDGRRRAERMRVYPPAETIVGTALEVEWFGRAWAGQRLQPVWVLFSGRTRQKYRKFEILNTY